MNVAFNTYQTFINKFTTSQLGYDAYSRNLSQSLLTSKYFASIQRATSAESLTLLSSIQSSNKLISTQSNRLQDKTRYEAPKASTDALKVVSSNQPLVAPLSVKVNALATSQTNLSKSYKSNDKSFLAENSFSMRFTIDEKTQPLNVNLTGARSNKEVLGRVANALNTTGIFKAEVIEEKEHVTLKVTNPNTGKDQRFIFEGSEASSLGLNTISTEAKDGSITVNETLIEQDTNQYTFKNEGLIIEVNAQTPDVTIIDNTLNVDLLSTDFKKLADALNALSSTYANNGNPFVKDRLEKGYALYKPELESMGIRMAQEGITVDSTQLKESLQFDPKANALLNRITNISTNAVKNLNPSSLIKEQLKKTYDTSENTPFYLNNLSNIIDNNPYKGSLLDMLV